jgi:hypothetical protein
MYEYEYEYGICMVVEKNGEKQETWGQSRRKEAQVSFKFWRWTVLW